MPTVDHAPTFPPDAANPDTSGSGKRPGRNGGILWHRPLPPLPRQESPGVLAHVTVAGPVECSFCFHNSLNPLNCSFCFHNSLNPLNCGQCESFCCSDDARCEEQHQASCPDRRAQLQAEAGVGGIRLLVSFVALFLVGSLVMHWLPDNVWLRAAVVAVASLAILVVALMRDGAERVDAIPEMHPRAEDKWPARDEERAS